MTADLVEFLLACFVEDEADARYLADAGRWSAHRDDDDLCWHVATESYGHMLTIGYVGNCSSQPMAQHIARHDPARVLAECEAKRRIVQIEAGVRVLRDDAPDHEVRTWSDEGHSVFVNGERMDAAEYERLFTEPAPPSLTLRLLALPYADHPEYREEWRP